MKASNRCLRFSQKHSQVQVPLAMPHLVIGREKWGVADGLLVSKAVTAWRMNDRSDGRERSQESSTHKKKADWTSTSNGSGHTSWKQGSGRLTTAIHILDGLALSILLVRAWRRLPLPAI